MSKIYNFVHNLNMIKYYLTINLFVMGLVSPVYSQLENLLVALQPDSAVVLHGRPIGSSPFYSLEFLTLVASVDSIMAALMDHGQSIDDYASVATAYADAKARGGLLWVPRKSKLFQDSTITVPTSADSMVVFDLRDGQLTILGQTNITAIATLSNIGNLVLTSDNDNDGTGDVIFRFGPDTSMVIKGDDGFVGINETSPVDNLHLTSSATSSPTIRLESTADDTTPPELFFKKNRANPADNDEIGIIIAATDNSAGSSIAAISVVYTAEDITSGAVSGGYEVKMSMNNTSRSFVKMVGFNGVVDQGEIIFNEDGQDVDFRVESSNNATSLVVVGNASGEVGVGTTPDSGVNLHVKDASSSVVITLESEGDFSTGPTLQLVFDDSSPDDGEVIANISAISDDDGGTPFQATQILSIVDDVTNGTEDTSFEFKRVVDGNLTPFFLQKSIPTTDAVATTIYTLATNTDTDYIIQVTYLSSQNDGTNEFYEIDCAALSNVSGTLTEDTPIDATSGCGFVDDNDGGAGVGIAGSISSANYLIQVTGVAGQIWNHTVTLQITEVAH